MAAHVGGIGVADHALQQRAAVSSVSASGWSVRASVHSSSAGLTRQRRLELRRTRSALASMSRPVSTNVIALRNPPTVFSDTLSVGAAARPARR